MGKKRGGRSTEDWDGESAVSSSTTFGEATARDDFEEEQLDLFHDALDQTTEKRASTREAALTALLGFMRADVRVDDCAQCKSTIIGRCINGMRRGGSVEASLAAQLLALHVISLPEHSEDNFLEAQFELQKSASSGGSVEARVAAIESLAMVCFVSVDDELLRHEVMEQLRASWGGRSSSTSSSGGAGADARAVTAALRGWSLLLTSTRSPLPSATAELVLSQLATLLHAPSVEVRAAAGEALALLYTRGSSSTRGLLQSLAEQDEEGDEEEEEEGQVEAAAGSTLSQEQHDMELEEAGEAEGVQPLVPDPNLISRMRQLAVAHPSSDAMRRSKRDRAAQRSAFRGILTTLERGGGVAPTKLKLQYGSTLVVDTAEGNVRLGAFRRALAGGFQVHMQRNALLHEVFQFRPAAEPPPRLTAAEKKATRSSNSADAKWRTADRKGGRAQKSMMRMGGDSEF